MARAAARKRAPAGRRAARAAALADPAELAALRAQLDRLAREGMPARWNADPDDVHRSVARLVLTLVEFVRKLLERQAIRRMETGTLTGRETEDVGRALMTLEATVRDIAQRFGLKPEDLDLDLGPLGRMM